MPYNLKTAEDILRAIKDDKIQIIDLRFTDLPGLWRKYSVPPSAFNPQSCEIQNGSMLIPDPASAFLDPFSEMPTLVLICNIRDALTGKTFAHDSRSIAQKAEAYLQKTQIGDTANFGLQFERFMFNGERSNESSNGDNSRVNTAELNLSAARWYQVPPDDSLAAVRAQIIAALERIGIEVKVPLYEITDHQDKIGMRVTTLTRMADNVMIYNYVVDHVARQHGMMEAFMPKPSVGNSGSGMLVHQSIWQGEQPLFAGDGYGGSSALMRHYIAGLLEHALAVLAICALMAKSNRRLMPGFEVPIKLDYSMHHSAGFGTPIGASNRKDKRVEFRCPHLSCNPYLAFAAMLMAGIDGFENRLYDLDPDEPIENFYHFFMRDQARTSLASDSLEELLNALEADHGFLLQGQVFTPEVIKAHLDYKRAHPQDNLRRAATLANSSSITNDNG